MTALLGVGVDSRLIGKHGAALQTVRTGVLPKQGETWPKWLNGKYTPAASISQKRLALCSYTYQQVFVNVAALFINRMCIE